VITPESSSWTRSFDGLERTLAAHLSCDLSLLLLLAEWRPDRIARVFPLLRGCWCRDCDESACKVVEECVGAIGGSKSEAGYSANRSETEFDVIVVVIC